MFLEMGSGVLGERRKERGRERGGLAHPPIPPPDPQHPQHIGKYGTKLRSNPQH
jgi:hypothetical protein